MRGYGVGVESQRGNGRRDEMKGERKTLGKGMHHGSWGKDVCESRFWLSGFHFGNRRLHTLATNSQYRKPRYLTVLLPVPCFVTWLMACVHRYPCSQFQALPACDTHPCSTTEPSQGLKNNLGLLITRPGPECYVLVISIGYALRRRFSRFKCCTSSEIQVDKGSLM